MSSRFIDQFEVILLDMARTFMFNVDRFSSEEDFAVTYRQIGGKTLGNGKVRQIIADLVSTIESDYQDPFFTAHFPSVRSYLEVLPSAQALPARELDLLEQIVALHEVGEIPDSHAKALHQLHQTHRLGVVSDIWSKKDLFLRAFAHAGVRHLFDIIVFSSEHGCVKPARSLFTKALAVFSIDPSQVVFIGDSLHRDIAGARAVGLATIWINAAGAARPTEQPQPDHEMRDLRELLKGGD